MIALACIGLPLIRNLYMFLVSMNSITNHVQDQKEEDVLSLHESEKTALRSERDGGYRISDAFLLLYCCTQYVTLTTQPVNLWVCRLMFVLYVSVAILTDVFPTERMQSRAISPEAVWCWMYVALFFISSLWSPSLVMSLNRTTINDMLHVAVIPFLLSYRIANRDALYRVISLYILLAAYVSVALILKTPRSDWGTLRVGSSVGTNPNTIGMLMSSAVFLLSFMSRYFNHKSLLALSIPFAYICMMTGSRKGIVFLVLAVIALPFFTRNVLKSFGALLFSLLIMLALYSVVMNDAIVYSLLGSRFEALFGSKSVVDYSLVERTWFLRYAMEHISEAPIFGHGLNAFMIRMSKIGYKYGAYSHCNYTELLYCYGIVGTLLYYRFHLRCLATSIVEFFHGNQFTLLPLFGISGLLILDYGMVSYLDVLNILLMTMLFLSLNLALGEKPC